jgi:hypothetical protein
MMWLLGAYIFKLLLNLRVKKFSLCNRETLRNDKGLKTVFFLSYVVCLELLLIDSWWSPYM